MDNWYGLFETHITVDTTDVKSFKAFCATQNLKTIFIELSNGKFAAQPMTATDMWGTFEEVKKAAYNTVRLFKENGFECMRVKIELAPIYKGYIHPDVPKTQEDLYLLNGDKYWEYHVKVLISNNQDYWINEVAEENDAHLSKNAFKIREDGLKEKFLTIRMYSSTMNEAQDLVSKLKGHLLFRNIEILSDVLEYCVYDTNPHIDEDWFEENETCTTNVLHNF